jgi:stalled ribosome rescue protein Dom34
MKIIEKEKEGAVLAPETLNDLWYLYSKAEGRTIWQKTLRTKTVCKGGEILRGGKTPCFLGIIAEKLRWEDNKIRITGEIVDGTDKGKHHSMYFELNEKTKISGELPDIPKEAKREIFICVADRNLSIISWLKGRNYGPVEEIKAGGRDEEYYKEVASRLKRENAPYMILTGHDTAKQKILNHLEKKENVFLDQTSSGGKDGLEEISRRDIIKQIFDKQREDSEKKIISETMACVKKNPEKALYGEGLQKEMERVKEVLVLSNFIEKHETLLKQLEEKGTKIDVIDGSKDYASELRTFEIVGVCYY